METIEIEVKPRQAKGTRASRRYRAEGLLPANIYNNKMHQEVLLNNKDFVRIGERAFTSQIFVIKSEQSELNGCKVVVKEVQKEFLKNQVLHVDLYKLEDNLPVRVNVPLKVVGEAPGVKTEGGVLMQSARKITVSCLPKDIPTQLEIDISSLNVGSRIKTGDIELANGVVLRSDPMETVVGVISGRASAAKDGAEAKPAEAAATDKAAAKPEAAKK